ncbi:tubulin polyglutamylase TTLL7-like [Mercenaria mercenaria]|uniref:tubulin polyglutamylase TTLL7-like n=1 Tax=Mercenaria mercenaria TaxID=6596 RepID=UPI001E1DAE49|nr:tubulin polyglutamylase TTLL7-like [Mercenaria mercenaria]XP_045158570.1 tubulin polyglutamylase TTLL7-like [Mercenaria mercenaria]
MSAGLKHSTSVSSLASMDKGTNNEDITLSSLHSHYSRRTSANMVLGPGGPSSGYQSHVRPENRQRQTDMTMERMDYDDDKRQRSQAKTKRKKRRNMITANLSGTRYDVIRQMVEHIGFSVAKDDDPTCFLIWNDSFVSTEKISDLKPYQRINHFPGMGEVTRKDNLARNMMKMAKAVPEEYNFVPRTWILPSDYNIIQNYMKDLKAHKKSKTFIVKPSNGAQGHGISLYKNLEKIPAQEHFIVQEYVEKPLLMDGYKFDLRIYVLITSCDPLRVFLFNDGLVRMSTEKYLPPAENNISHLFMHLTNYSVNKHNEFYEKGASLDAGSKRSIKSFNEYLRRNDYDVALLWRNISDMIVKTLIVAEPHILHAYRMCRPGAPAVGDSVCFEVLGFDVLIDRKLRPWLLEINRSPSFGTDEKIDFDIKSALIEDTIRLLNIKMSDKKKNMTAQKLEAQKRLFRPSKRVSDTADMTEYDKKRASIERRKDELKELLSRVKKAGSREEYENRNRGRFIRIFPSDDKVRQGKYIHLLEAAYSTFMSGRATSMHKEIQLIYNNKLKESDIMDMIAECESDEQQGRLSFEGKRVAGTRGPKPLASMPSSDQFPGTDREEDEEESESASPPSSPYHRGSRSRPGSVNSRLSNNRTPSIMGSRPNSGMVQPGGRPMSSVGPGQSRSLSRQAGGQKLTNIQRSNVDDNFLTNVIREREEELVRRTLQALNDMRIKFPGKSDQEADTILDKLYENWKFHKPRIASYWLVKLDSIKRRKVIDIVRSNVRAVLQRTWRVTDVDSLPVYRMFSRVFNRLLWSHGQGLWNCFASSGNQASWETIFSKSSDTVDEVELNCCRRIVQLCKDCLLIVYQFAAEAKNASQGGDRENEAQVTQRSESKPSLIPPNTQTMSQRYSKLYARTESTS